MEVGSGVLIVPSKDSMEVGSGVLIVPIHMSSIDLFVSTKHMNPNKCTSDDNILLGSEIMHYIHAMYTYVIYLCY